MDAKRLNLDLSRGLGGSLEDPTNSERNEAKDIPAYQPLRNYDSSQAHGADDAADDSNARGFAGLQNQGATCYMNSLLQTLFMTPEFRRLMYSWKYDAEVEGDEKDCIPLQLQKLFGTLQLTSRRAVGTTLLTKSFQWTSVDAFRQHDVQELMRVLLDALERALRASGHPTPTAVNDLFRGVYNDYVRTATAADLKQAGEKLPEDDDSEQPPGAKVKGGLATESIARSQNAEFMDLSLVIKPFGASKALGSVEESLTAFIASEVMAGSNKVQFDELGEGVRVPAVKGLKVTKPPYILTLQLKRFDLDMMSPTLARIKLNDRVTFPVLLDFNQWVGKEGSEVQSGGAQAATEGGSDSTDTHAKTDSTAAAAGAGTGAGDEAGASGASQADEVRKELPPGMDKTEDYGTFKERAHKIALQNGPYVYELYAVLVHSGSAVGGHYYVYIRDLDSGQWRNFNDSTVSDIDIETVKEAFGGAKGNSLYASSASAYMLVYRRMTFEDVPVPDSDEGGEGGATQDSVAAAAETANQQDASDATAPAAAEAAVDGEVAAAAAEFGVSRQELLSGRSCTFPPRDAVPAYVQEAMEKDVAAELEAELARTRSYNSIKLKVRYGDRLLDLPAQRTQTLQEVTEIAWRLLGLEKPKPVEGSTSDAGAEAADSGEAGSPPTGAEAGQGESQEQDGATGNAGKAASQASKATDAGGANGGGQYLPLDCVRLREFRTHNGSLGVPYDGTKATQTVGEASMYSGMQLILETREPDAEFPEFDPQAVTIKVRKYLRDEGDFTDAVPLSIRRSASLAALKRMIETHKDLGIRVENQRILKMSKYGSGANMNFTLRVLAGDHLALGNAFYLGSGTEVYVEDVSGEQAAADFDPFTSGEEAGVTEAAEGGAEPSEGGPAASLVPDGTASAPTPPAFVTLDRDAIMALPKEGALINYGLQEGLLPVTAADSAAVGTFKELAHRVRVRYRLLGSKAEGLPFYLDLRSTVGELRAAVAQRLDVSPERLLLDKVHESHTVGMSLKDDDVLLSNLYFMPTTVLMTREGQRLKPGQVNIKLSLYTPAHLNGTGWATNDAQAVMDTDESTGDTWVSYGGWAPKPMFAADRARIPVTGKYPDERHDEEQGGDQASKVEGGDQASKVEGGARGADNGATADPVAEGTPASSPAAEEGHAAPDTTGAAGEGTSVAAAGAGGDDVAVDGGGADKAAATPVDDAPPYSEDWYSSAPYPEPAEMTYESLGAHPLSLTDEVNEVKQLAKALLVKGGRLDEACSVQRIRLRLKSGVRPGKVLPDGTTLAASFSALYEHMELQIEVVPQPEEHMLGKTKRERAEEQAKVEEQKEGGGVTSEEGGAPTAAGAAGATTGEKAPGSSYASAAATGADVVQPPARTPSNDVDFDDLLLVVQWLDVSRHKLTLPREIRVTKGASVSEAVLVCAELAQVPIGDVQWVLHAGGKMELWHVRNQPWYFACDHQASNTFRSRYTQDGALLLLRDSRQPRRELSDADMSLLNPYARPLGSGSTTSSRLAGTFSSAARYRPREQGVKITVKAEANAAAAASGATAPAASAGSSTDTSSSAVAAASTTATATITQISHSAAPVEVTDVVSRMGKTEEEIAREAAVRAQLRAEAAASGEGEEELVHGGAELFDVFEAFGDD